MKIFNLALIMVIVAMIIGGVWYWHSTENTITRLSNENKALQNLVDVLKGELVGYDIKLSDPTYGQVKAGLVELKKVNINGNCCDQSKCAQDYFYEKGLQCYIVISNLKNGDGHVSVAFDTKDNGWVYVEPQGMNECPIILNKPYFPPGIGFTGKIGQSIEELTDGRTVTQIVKVR